MKLQILGTAAAEGWPAMFCTCQWCREARRRGGKDIRTRSGAIIDDQLMIDFSPDAYFHEMKFGLDYTYVHTVLITHDHEDHLFAADFGNRYPGYGVLDGTAPEVLTVYGNDRVGLQINHGTQGFGGPGGPVQFKRVVPFAPTKLEGGYTFTALTALHDRSQQCYLYLIEDKQGKRMLYGHDTGLFVPETMAALKGVHLDLVMLDCTMGKYRDGGNHMGIEDCFEMKERLTANGSIDASTRMVLTHFSHNGHMLHDELVAAAQPKGFDVAYDGVIYEI